MTPHTPGPWEAHHTDKGYAIRPSGTGYLLASLTAGSFTYGANLPDGPPHDLEANARLIAAAPELLAALKQIVDESQTGSPYAVDLIRGLARGAIAKAEGCEA